MNYILILIIFILICLLPFMYWLGKFNKENELGRFLSSSKFKDTNYREWKEWSYSRNNEIP